MPQQLVAFFTVLAKLQYYLLQNNLQKCTNIAYTTFIRSAGRTMANFYGFLHGQTILKKPFLRMLSMLRMQMRTQMMRKQGVNTVHVARSSAPPGAAWMDLPICLFWPRSQKAFGRHLKTIYKNTYYCYQSSNVLIHCLIDFHCLRKAHNTFTQLSQRHFIFYPLRCGILQIVQITSCIDIRVERMHKMAHN